MWSNSGLGFQACGSGCGPIGFQTCGCGPIGFQACGSGRGPGFQSGCGPTSVLGYRLVEVGVDAYKQQPTLLLCMYVPPKRHIPLLLQKYDECHCKPDEINTFANQRSIVLP